jgi:cytoskeletal protein CcmA (bactofilin family)
MLFGSDDKKKKNKKTQKQISTIINQGTTIEGEVEVEESIRVDGRLNGKLVVEGDILVGKTGKLKADVEGENIEIAGEVEGDVRANGKLRLLKDGKLTGDICYSNLVINDGALFKGTSISEKKSNKTSSAPKKSKQKNKKKIKKSKN